MKVLALLSLSACLFASGCCAVRVSTKGDRTLCDADNSCLLVCNVIPLFSGDPKYPNKNECIGFENTTTVSNNLVLINRERMRHKADALRDVTSFRTEEQVFFFLLKRSTLHTSAEFVYLPK